MNDEPKDLDPKDQADESGDNHEVPFVSSVKDENEDAVQFGSNASPAVLGEESPGGDATNSEPRDIDDDLAAAGLSNDDDGVKPLGE